MGLLSCFFMCQLRCSRTKIDCWLMCSGAKLQSTARKQPFKRELPLRECPSRSRVDVATTTCHRRQTATRQLPKNAATRVLTLLNAHEHTLFVMQHCLRCPFPRGFSSLSKQWLLRQSTSTKVEAKEKVLCWVATAHSAQINQTWTEESGNCTSLGIQKRQRRRIWTDQFDQRHR